MCVWGGGCLGVRGCDLICKGPLLKYLNKHYCIHTGAIYAQLFIVTICMYICLVKNITNITITSNSSVKVAHIICHNDTVPTRGIGFINISGLYLYNLHIYQCGGIFNTDITFNNTWLYFPIGLTICCIAISSL